MGLFQQPERIAMRVALLTVTWGWGGAELHTVRLAETFTALGHQADIVQLGHEQYDRAPVQIPPKIGIQRRPLRLPPERAGWAESRAAIRNVRGDVGVFVKQEFSSGSLALDLLARRHFPCYCTIEHLIAEPMPPKTSRRHLGGLVPGLGLWWLQAFGRRWARSLGPHRIFCVSEAIRQRLVGHYRFPDRKVATAHNGIDPERFRPSEGSRERRRAAWGVPDGALLFGAVGRLADEKRYDLALELFRRLLDLCPDRAMRLVLVGEGRAAPRLRQLVDALDLGSHVRFEPFSPEAWTVYPAFDVFLMPSRTEGLPLALLEAMACGCPAVAMSVGGVPEVIRRPDLGWLVPADDRDGFFRAMQAALQAGPEARLDMGRRARAEVVAHFDERSRYLALARHIQDAWESCSPLRRRLLCRAAAGGPGSTKLAASGPPPGGRRAHAGD
ncbi:MAG TPA: glycosyltransferase family 4 protein, partial [Candidatus Sulfotelmatobacter sp.]|nr:glycosyltransferase family 4 protein [Candidatus Sulfotelmatobacter sp.]